MATKYETRLNLVISQEMKLAFLKKCDKEEQIPSAVIRKLIKKYLEEDKQWEH